MTESTLEGLESLIPGLSSEEQGFQSSTGRTCLEELKGSIYLRTEGRTRNL